MKRMIRNTSLGLAALASGGLAACNQDDECLGSETQATVAEHAPDDSYVVLTGTAVQTAADHFIVDYGEGQITVEMDDYDWYAEGHNIVLNDDVVVYGYIDDDLYEKRTIEASSVYVRDLGTQFYASGADEEDFPVVSVPVDYDPRIDIAGTVDKVGDFQFTMETAGGKLVVDTHPLPYDPLDDEGFQQGDEGDRVRVSGRLDEGLMANQKLFATNLITMQPSAGKQDKQAQGGGKDEQGAADKQGAAQETEG